VLRCATEAVYEELRARIMGQRRGGDLPPV